MLCRASLLLVALLTLSLGTGSSPQQAFVLAVSDFTGENPALCQAVTEIVLTDLAKSRQLTLVERAQLRHALSELRLGQSGLIANSDMARAAKLIGATHVVVGSVSVNEQRVILNARVLDVRTGAVHSGAAENTEGWTDELFQLAHELAHRLHLRLTGEALPSPNSTLPPPPAPEEPPASRPLAPPPPPPDWQNLDQTEAIAYALSRGWMRLFADGTFRPYETVSERYFYETLRQMARRYRLEVSSLFPTHNADKPILRLEAVRRVERWIRENPPYFLEVPTWAIGWLGNTPHKPLTRAQFAELLRLIEQQLHRKITPSPSASSLSAEE